MKIEQPHGVLIDVDGKVVKRFGGWSLGDHDVPDAVESVEYIDGPVAHTKSIHWQYDSGEPPVSLSSDSSTIVNDGSDSAILTMTLDADAEQDYSVTLDVDGGLFNKSLSPGTSETEEITTTTSEGHVIEAVVDGDSVQRSDVVEIEVIS